MNMNMNSWDPLATDQQLDQEMLFASQRRQISNILKSYVGMYDSFSELIQNAMDAVDKRRALENEKFKGKLWLTVNLQDNSFSITDNGVGLKEDEFKSFLAPNISFKVGKKSRGNKGVGATYIGYGFNFIQFGTKHGAGEFVGELVNGRAWVDDKDAVVSRPQVQESTLIDNHFLDIDRGTTFTIKFGGDNIRPKSLAWFTAQTAEQWLYLLKIKTPLGSIPFLNDKENELSFNLKVINKNGTVSELKDEEAKYIYPHEKIKASVDLTSVLEKQQELLLNGGDASKLPAKYFKSNGVYQSFSTEQVLELSKNFTEQEIDLILEYEVEAYGYFVYSVQVWDHLNDRIAKLRKNYRVLRGGLQLATNRMIQGDIIQIPLTKSIGNQNQSHVIVHFNNADPDLGRKGFQPELKLLGEKISVAIVNKLRKWKHLLRTDTGAKPDIVKEANLSDWIKEQEVHEKESPLNLNNPNFFKPINEISVTSIPQSEQDVIVLFNQLIAGGVIRGLKLLATSQIKQYDGVFRFCIKEPFEIHEFDKDTNPLGVETVRFTQEHESVPKILEYKFNVDALIREFECEDKNEKDIDLVVAWELGSEWTKNYEIVSLLDLDNIHQRDFHGITHLLISGNTKINAICLKELISYLHDIEEEQTVQRNKYSQDLF